ncbi:unnamed protein product [Acanthoscelides obtectus]|uniref:Uncharacterized protein n=1 Tax=Acanthoscelides obtectus TaxID=200917 RepID=A0A9P0PF81_ACAOB|nr:unnamed protein product [Acanthoscelides obtectus]CAK1659043.1 hypothetical protein AOBTE_LOCUS21260 [Acanthoscelides obtectus]
MLLFLFQVRNPTSVRGPAALGSSPDRTN